MTAPEFSVTTADPLSLLQSLVRTAAQDTDPLASREDAAAWLASAGLLPSDAALSGSELNALHRLRGALGDVLTARAGGRADADAGARLTRALADGRLVVTVSADGAAGLASSARAPYSNLVAVLAIAVAKALRADSVRRDQ